MLNFKQKKMLKKAEKRILEKKKLKHGLDKSGWNGIDFLNDHSYYNDSDGRIKRLLKKVKDFLKASVSTENKKLRNKAILKAEREDGRFYHE